MKKRRVHFVLATHWDREWRESFQELRYDMVRLFDRILAGLSDGRLQGPFVSDGQSVLLEDYLTIRPERREELERLLQNGRIVAGPWYTMPDEFAVSGESLVRNLRMGREVVRAMGAKPSDAGFVCDMFGHNSQMPQIFAGFGMGAGFIWRGVNLTDTRTFLWVGADGTEIPCYRFGPIGYGTYASFVRGANDFNYQLEPERFAKDWDAYLRNELVATDVDPVLIIDTCDHQEWDEPAYRQVLEQLKKDTPECEIVHTSLDEYARELIVNRSGIKTRVEGELREPGRSRMTVPRSLDGDEQWVIPGVLSSRVWIKQANRACETLLCHWAEPFSAVAREAIGFEPPPGFLDLAWRSLLENHAHDSIGGCSVDQVHRDMAHRFDQCRLIADKVTKEATYRLAASVEGELSDDEFRVTVFNPLPRPLDEIVELALQVPGDWPGFMEFFGYELKPAFRIYGAQGDELPYQRLAQAPHRIRSRIRETKFPEGVGFNEVRVALPLAIPATGYTTLIVRSSRAAAAGARSKNAAATYTRHPAAPGLATSERSMENQHLAVQVESNGTLTITDRRTAQTYRRLLTFEDTADIGDGWYHGVAVNDQTFVSAASASAVALVHDGPMLTRFRVRTVLSVPQDFRSDRMTRSDRFAELILDSLVTLREDNDYLEVETRVENAADDHRLRVLFPTGAYAETYLADSQFDVVERQIALRSDNHEYREIEVETKPQQSWTAVSDGQRGLAIVADGLLETAVRDLPDRPIALTLFRGTRRTAFTTGEPEGQLRGGMTFRYYILSIADRPDRARLCELGQKISAGLRAVQLRRQDLEIYRASQSIPAAAEFLRLTGAAVMTSMKPFAAGLEIRLFNPYAKKIKSRVHVKGRFPSTSASHTVQYVNLDGEPLGPSQQFSGELSVELRAKQIITLRIGDIVNSRS